MHSAEPMDSAYLPLSQAAQPLGSVKPAVAWKVPFAHAAQCCGVLVAIPCWPYLPASHAVHVICATPAWKWPAAHTVHAAAAVIAGALCVVSAAPREPSVQLLHDVLHVLGWYLPCGHSVATPRLTSAK